MIAFQVIHDPCDLNDIRTTTVANIWAWQTYAEDSYMELHRNHMQDNPWKSDDAQLPPAVHHTTREQYLQDAKNMIQDLLNNKKAWEVDGTVTLAKKPILLANSWQPTDRMVTAAALRRTAYDLWICSQTHKNYANDVFHILEQEIPLMLVGEVTPRRDYELVPVSRDVFKLALLATHWSQPLELSPLELAHARRLLNLWWGSTVAEQYNYNADIAHAEAVTWLGKDLNIPRLLRRMQQLSSKQEKHILGSLLGTLLMREPGPEPAYHPPLRSEESSPEQGLLNHHRID